MSQLVMMVLLFVQRTALVRILGDGVTGLNGLFTEVIAMLSLAEMGVGSAISYSLYQPLAQQDTAHVHRLMSLFRTAYRVIAAAVFALGLCLLPFIQNIVRKVDIDVNFIRLAFFLFLLKTSASYLFSYKAALLRADQQNHLVSRVSMVMKIVESVVRIAILLILRDFFAYLAADVVMTLLTNLWISRVADREYPFLREPSEMPPRAESRSVLSNIRHLFIGSLSSKVTNSTDNILISVLDAGSTLSVGYYTNYSLITNNIRMLLSQVSEATGGAIGNVMVEETPKRCADVLRRLTFLIFLPTVLVSVCFACCLSPVVTLWLGPQRTLTDMVVYAVTGNFFLSLVRDPLWRFLQVSGLFKKDKWISLTGTLINLVVSVALGIPWGMLGVFLGTIATHLTQMVLKTRLLYKEKFGLSCAPYAALLLRCTLALLLSSVACILLCGLIGLSPLGHIAVCCPLCLLVTSGVVALLFIGSDEMRYAVSLVRTRLRKLLHRRSAAAS